LKKIAELLKNAPVLLKLNLRFGRFHQQIQVLRVA